MTKFFTRDRPHRIVLAHILVQHRGKPTCSAGDPSPQQSASFDPPQIAVNLIARITPHRSVFTQPGSKTAAVLGARRRRVFPAPPRHPQRGLQDLPGVQVGHSDVPQTDNTEKMAPFPRSNHRQFPGHISRRFSGYHQRALRQPMRLSGMDFSRPVA